MSSAPSSSRPAVGPRPRNPLFGTRSYSRARIALYATMAALLFLLERWIPNPLPWVRLGLANVVTLAVLLLHGWRWASAVVALRLILGGFFAGTLFGPQFLLALSGGVASLVTMAAAWQLLGRFYGPVGLSVLGSMAHAAAQLGCVALLFGAGEAIWAWLPLFGTLSVLSGSVTGVCVRYLVLRLIRLPSTVLQ